MSPSIHGPTYAQGQRLTLVILLAAAAIMIGCQSQKSETNPASATAVALPEILSLAPPDAATTDKIVLSWKPMSGIQRFVLCETVPPYGTNCEDQMDVSEATVTVPQPADGEEATGTWLKYLWLQSCRERECSKPPTAAGAIAHRIVFRADAWNFVVVVRRLERYEVEVTLANTSQGTSEASTLVARTPDGSEIARCENVAPGQWCGPFEGTLLSNDIVAEQIYRNVGATLEFPVMPSSTGPEPGSQPAP